MAHFAKEGLVNEKSNISTPPGSITLRPGLITKVGDNGVSRDVSPLSLGVDMGSRLVLVQNLRYVSKSNSRFATMYLAP